MEPEFYDSIKHRLRMLFEDRRLETFKSWCFDNTKKCSAAKLAEAGFYFIGTNQDPDAVQCFFCDKELDGWDEGDDPWAEHLKHSKNCTFAQLAQPEAALSLQQMMDFHSKLVKKQIEKGSQEIITTLSDNFRKNRLKAKKAINGLKKC